MKSTIIAILMLILVSPAAQGRTWTLHPDGSGDCPTIAAALDSSVAGDVIELTCGTYFEHGLIMPSQVTLRSETGQPDCVTIQGQDISNFGSIIGCWAVDSTTLIEGLTLTGGRQSDSFFGVSGGGMLISTGSDPTVNRCRIIGNYARSGGGVAIVSDSHPVFVECDITHNASMFYPGGVLVAGNSSLTAHDTVIAENSGSEDPLDGRVSTDSAAYLFCCDIQPEHWSFAGTLVVDDSNCGPVTTDQHPWGALKALYR